MARSWTDYDIEYLKKHWPYCDKNEIAIHLNKTLSAVKQKANTLKIKRSVNLKHTYTQADDEYIINNYANTRSELMANHIGVSLISIYNRAHNLGLKKSKEFIIAESKRVGVSDAAKKHWFKKGQKAHNKGQKMTPELYAKCAPTMFKKGNKPHNTRADGEISIRGGYQYIRVEESKWVLLQRYNWEKHYGKIPKGHNIIFKDNNQLNCELSNLELVSNEELMRRNSIQNYSPELVTAMQNLGRLNSKIKHYEKQD